MSGKKWTKNFDKLLGKPVQIPPAGFVLRKFFMLFRRTLANNEDPPIYIFFSFTNTSGGMWTLLNQVFVETNGDRPGVQNAGKFSGFV